ncbi:sigma 54-interacting transcriptional regulator, partial [Salinimonas sp. HHU 13199]
MNRISSHALINFALDLSGAVTTENSFERLIAAICATISCDAVALLLHEQGTLTPAAQRGLSPDVMGRRFLIHQHPRLKVICNEYKAVRFAADCALPDPYDGMICNHDTITVHSCMGIPLYKDSQLLGVLTLDSVAPNQFDLLDNTSLDTLASLASGFLASRLIIDQLQSKTNQAQHILQAISEHNAEEHNQAEMIGTSTVIKSLKKSIRLAASSELTILIEGESGVGKELVARALHQQSNRKSKPLVYVNCAAIARHLIESELFGHVKGAFTNADKDRQGKFLLADGG